MSGASVTIFLLLLIAVAAGWLMAKFTGPKQKSVNRKITEIYHDYFVGLNYLLRDEPDEAIDTFIRALEINGETIETHLALGALLRRRGKVDKAINVHRELLERNGLGLEFADSVRLELATDYIAAGLLDRAERLLNELLSAGRESKWEALSQLITVYQTEKEWLKAVECADLILANPAQRKKSEYQHLGAHFCCELANLALDEDKIEQARMHIQKAFQFDKNSVRASLIAALIDQISGNYRSAIQQLVRIRERNPQFISELIKPLAECFEQLNELDEYEKFLHNCQDEQPRVTVLLELVRLLRVREGDAAAIRFLTGQMKLHPSLKGMAALLEIQAVHCEGSLQEELSLMQTITRNWMRSKPAYRCDHCGFETKSLFWQCPSCHKWDAIAPILGIEGE